MIRLNKYIARAGLASRREADRLISEGRVKVNGRIVDELGAKIDETRDEVRVRGRLIRPAKRLIYLALNKPLGYVVTRKDPLQRPTVMELLPVEQKNVFPVGRLDLNSEGLLLLTNDGELSNRLLHPRNEIKKVYRVLVNGRPTQEKLTSLEKGIVIDGRKTAPAHVKVLGGNSKRTALRIEIHEGRKREIRRMLEAVGHPVAALKRIRFAGIPLGQLKSGRWRHLSSAEVSRLKKLVNL